MSTFEESVEDQNDQIVYRVKIKKFRDKMFNWPHGKEVEFRLQVYPSGNQDAKNGFVSIYLRNEGSRKIQVFYQIRLDTSYICNSLILDPCGSPTSARGIPNFYPHKACANYGSIIYQKLEIVCTISDLEFLDGGTSLYKEAKSAADDAEYTKSTVYQVQNDVEDLKKENVALKGLMMD